MALGLRERKKQETARVILKEAKRLFVSEGFDAVSVEQIAEAASVSRATLFNYFPSKASLLVALAERRESDFQHLLERVIQEHSGTFKRIIRLFELWSVYLMGDPKIHAMVTSALNAGARSEEDSAAALGNYMDAFRRLLQLGLDIGDVRTDYSIEAMAQLACSTMISGSYALFEGRDKAAQEHYLESSRLLAESLTTGNRD